MTMTRTCPRREAVIEADDQDDPHAREDHSLEHTLPRKHILSRLRRLETAEDS